MAALTLKRHSNHDLPSSSHLVPLSESVEGHFTARIGEDSLVPDMMGLGIHPLTGLDSL
jgi:hypothetical protein